MDPDMQKVLSLPGLFPNITSLQWRIIHEFEKTEQVNKSLGAQALQQRKNIQSLVDFTNHFSIALWLLEATRCDKLTRLQIKFDDCTYLEDEGIRMH